MVRPLGPWQEGPQRPQGWLWREGPGYQTPWKVRQHPHRPPPVTLGDVQSDRGSLSSWLGCFKIGFLEVFKLQTS